MTETYDLAIYRVLRSLPLVGAARELQPHWPPGPIRRVVWALQVLCEMCVYQVPEQTHRVCVRRLVTGLSIDGWVLGSCGCSTWCRDLHEDFGYPRIGARSPLHLLVLVPPPLCPPQRFRLLCLLLCWVGLCCRGSPPPVRLGAVYGIRIREYSRLLHTCLLIIG